ncbi:unnamed protein product [Orchesella dallaii]|uniref:C2H2-type domain-containing protein n=1 Tax=Orchesella dallaii TaxID=48710 RepID=A0ABP1PT19_9HEXA
MSECDYTASAVPNSSFEEDISNSRDEPCQYIYLVNPVVILSVDSTTHYVVNNHPGAPFETIVDESPQNEILVIAQEEQLQSLPMHMSFEVNTTDSIYNNVEGNDVLSGGAAFRRDFNTTKPEEEEPQLHALTGLEMDEVDRGEDDLDEEFHDGNVGDCFPCAYCPYICPKDTLRAHMLHFHRIANKGVVEIFLKAIIEEYNERNHTSSGPIIINVIGNSDNDMDQPSGFQPNFISNTTEQEQPQPITSAELEMDITTTSMLSPLVINNEDESDEGILEGDSLEKTNHDKDWRYTCALCEVSMSCVDSLREHTSNVHRIFNDYAEVLLEQTVLWNPTNQQNNCNEENEQPCTPFALGEDSCVPSEVSCKSSEASGSSTPTIISNNNLNLPNKIEKKKRNPIDIPDFIEVVVGGKPKKYKCTICKKDFNTKSNVKYHESCFTGKKPYRCEEKNCGKEFIAKSHFLYHKLRHQGIKPHKCTVCEMKFIQPSKLKRHMKSHTGEKLCVCLVCNKGYSSKDALRYHNLSHTKERPYPCPDCNKRFKDKTSLKRHSQNHYDKGLVQFKKTHSTNRKREYACNLCEAAFSSNKDLKRHLRRHTGEKPFICNICKNSFPRHDNLRRHITSQHNKSKEEANRMTSEANAEYLKKTLATSQETATNSGSVVTSSNTSAEPCTTSSNKKRGKNRVQPLISRGTKRKPKTMPERTSSGCRKSLRLSQKQEAEGSIGSKVAGEATSTPGRSV